MSSLTDMRKMHMCSQVFLWGTSKLSHHHHKTSVTEGKWLPWQRGAAGLLKWVHMHTHLTHTHGSTHKCRLKQGCAQAQSIRRRVGGGDRTFIYRVYFTCFSWFIIYESINLHHATAAYRVWLLSRLFSHLPVSMCLPAYLALQGLCFAHQTLSLCVSHFLSLLFCLSSLSIVHLCHQTGSFYSLIFYSVSKTF